MGGVSLSRSLQSVNTLCICLIFPFYFPHLVSAIDSTVPAGSTRDTLPNLVHPTNVSTLTAPDPPIGFEVDIHYDTSRTLNPLGVYLSAIDCMYHFAQIGWYKGFAEGVIIWAERFDVQVNIRALRGPHDPVVLETIHIVLGLYDTLLDVAAQSRFCEVDTALWLHRRQLGYLRIERRTPEKLKKGTDATNMTVVKAIPQSNDMTYPSGQFIDTDDPEFSIHYTFSGARITSKSIFLAVLGGLADSAQYSPARPFRSLHSISPSRDCVIDILKIDSPFQVNYSFITKALRLTITEIIIPLRKFEEVTLQLKWQALTMAEASMKLANRGAVAG